MEYTVTERFEPLYKRDTTGSVREWRMEVGAMSNGNAAHRSIAGLKDGNVVTSEWKKANAKNVGRSNQTNSLEQARMEVMALYEKQRGKGYFASLDAIDTFEKFKPMLAHDYHEYPLTLASLKYFSQPKLDGIRCIARRDGLWTRAGKPILATPHVYEALAPHFALYPDAIFDGELYNHELKDDFNKITSMVRKTKPTDDDITESASLVQYHIYDYLQREGDTSAFIDRQSELNGLADFFLDNDTIQFVETVLVQSHEELDELYGEYLERGFEGQMVRDGTSAYANKRTKYLLKRKEFLTAEFPVSDMLEGQGNWSGYIKRFALTLADGREFGAGVRGNQATLRKLFEAGAVPDWATLRYFTPTPDGVPRFPVVVDWGWGARDD